ncbi:D-lactate dehydrogenase (cytochrome) [Malassezia brasiliensis]|uniref:D-lactate dehydrogenase (Cytochrome) n=1 Tax=Malassezia brasiliensis TaxID=1821822 RepID=A0AAF0IP53_9BASI|nr:D-lactate dehydrogenase (cytochrome) [Malassezia brasiliensis]
MSMDTFDPNQAENLPEIEKQIAVRCVEHAQTYWNLLERIKGSKLRLTKYDDEIMAEFEAILPDVFGNDQAVRVINEDDMKSAQGKTKWREFIAKYEKKVADFNFGTLIRTNASDEYTQTNTIFLTRFQFYVFEIARCRRGMNDWVHEQALKAKEGK